MINQEKKWYLYRKFQDSRFFFSVICFYLFFFGSVFNFMNVAVTIKFINCNLLLQLICSLLPNKKDVHAFSCENLCVIFDHYYILLFADVK